MKTLLIYFKDKRKPISLNIESENLIRCFIRDKSCRNLNISCDSCEFSLGIECTKGFVWSEVESAKYVTNKMEKKMVEEVHTVGNSEIKTIGKKSALDIQVAGNHYKNMVIQPAVFCQKNQLNFCESSVIKYVCRHKNKKGIEDLKKAKHFIDLLIDIEYGEENEKTN